ncbi:MAG: hypothetical protein IJO81_04135 [Clostridia bacterium]|nr:hypothetical protein [Clostridia bacterium]
MLTADKRFLFEGRNKKYYEQVLTRLKCRDAREGAFTGTADDGKQPFVDAFKNNPDESGIVCQAIGIVNSWLESEIVITEGEYFMCFNRSLRPMFEHFSYGIQGVPYEWKDSENEEERELRRRMTPLDFDHLDRRGYELMGEAYKGAGRLWWAGGYQGHTVPSYNKLLKLGIGGTIEQINYYDSITPEGNKKKKDFYKACRIVMEGFSAWFKQYADACEEAAKTAEPEWSKELLRNAENLRTIAWDAPKNLHEAGQLMWGYALWDWVDCVGRFDQYLYPFWTGSREDHEMIAELIMKVWEHGSHNVVIGGVKPEDGTDASNEISYLVLQTIRTLHDVHPRVSFRVHENTPADLLELAVTLWSEGMSDPTVASDKNVIEGLMEYGVPIEDARDYTLLGCQEIEIPGKSNFGCEDGSINLAKILEITFNHGRDLGNNGLQLGLDLGGLTDFDTFDKLWDAYTAQIEYLTRIHLDLCNMGVDIRNANVAKLVKSCMTEACIERGLNMDDGGTIYNYGCIETGGHGTVGDSLYAMKKLVYDEKKITLEELDAALKANFEGYEEIRQMLLAVPKYGNGDEEADAMSAKVLEHYWTEIGKYTSRRGGVFTGACSLLEGGISMGRNLGAMPDGRFAGEPLGNTIGPRTGSDKSGVTNMLLSVSRMPLKLGVGGSGCNVLFPRELMQTVESRAKVAGLIKAFMMMGGQLAQITTASKEDMIAAQKNPEDWGNLIVRVGGYSQKFIEIGRSTQDEIIKRYGD